MNQTELKQSLRENALSNRDQLTLRVREANSLAIKERLLESQMFGEAMRILFYASFRSEVETLSIIKEALQKGKEVVLPRVCTDTKTLTKHPISGMLEVTPGYMGIPEPNGEIQYKVEQMDMIVIPGAAFAADGSRIGYGGGYYDKLLSRIKGSKPIVALAFESQIVENIPTEGHDVMMDYIITEKRIIDCHG
jgi:5-formyltetrahydrofolate cyclo-ligase